MAIAFSQSSSSENDGAAGNFSLKFTNANSAGNCIVVDGTWGANSNSGVSVSDAAGNSYVTAWTQNDATNNQSAGCWYALNIASNSANTVTLNTPATGFLGVAIHEYSGVLSASASDGTNTNTSTSATPSSNSLLPSVDGEVLHAFVCETSGTGTFNGVKSFTTREVHNGNAGFFSADSIQGNATSSQCTWGMTSSLLWLAGILALRPTTTGSVMTLYCSNVTASSSTAGTLTTVQPAAGTTTTGWTVGTTVAARFSNMTFNTKKAAATFGTTALPSGPDTSFGQATWRLSAATSGTFDGGIWYSSASVIAVTNASSQAGKINTRIYRSSSATGASATELTSGINSGTTVTTLTTTVAQSSSMSTRIASVTLNNEYLFMEVAWDITTAATNASADVVYKVGNAARTLHSGLITPPFTPTPVGGASTGYIGYLRRRKAAFVDGQ